MTKENELLPCPFCGGEASVSKTKSKIWVQCEQGHKRKDAELLLTPVVKTIVIDEVRDAVVINRWNDRPIEEQLKAENERLREALEKIANSKKLTYFEKSKQPFNHEIAKQALEGDKQ